MNTSTFWHPNKVKHKKISFFCDSPWPQCLQDPSSKINDSVRMLPAGKDWNIWKYLGYCLHANFVLSKVRQFEAELHGLYDIEILFQSPELKAVEATIVRWDFLDIRNTPSFARDHSFVAGESKSIFKIAFMKKIFK